MERVFRVEPIMKNLINKVYQFIFPFVSVWIIIIYFRILINYHNVISSWVYFILFIPVIFFERLASSLILQEKPIRLLPLSGKHKILLWGKIIFWYLLFLAWVVILPNSNIEDKRLVMALINSMVVQAMMHMYRAESYLTGVAFILWMGSYYFITVKKRRLKIFNSLILPAILSYFLYYHFYFLGGVGDYPPGKISMQKGVEIFYSKEDFPIRDPLQYKNWTKECRFYPRDIYIDTEQNAMYSNYANTNDESLRNVPTILRIDLKTKETKYFLESYAKVMSVHTSTILASPFFKRKIYELSKKDMSVIRVFPAQVEIDYWETLDIYHDSKRNYIYLSNDVSPALLKYDYKTGKLIDFIYPESIRYGGGMINMKLSDKTGMMYIISYMAKQDLLEIEPESFDIERTLNLNNYGVFGFGSSSLELDDENGLLYLQHAGRNKLYEIDIARFKVRRVLKGVVAARDMLIDKKRNALYLSSYFYGKLVALDLESGKQVWTLKVGGKPYGIALNNNDLYVNSRAGIIKIDLETVWKE